MYDFLSPAVKIDSVEDEARHLSGRRCECGGRFLVGTQSHEWDERHGRHLVVDHAQCSDCGRVKKFAFDVTGYFTVNSS